MALYPISGSTGATIAEVKRGLLAAGAITQIFYETASYLIFSSPFSNKIIKLYTADVLTLFIGDAYISTNGITNEVRMIDTVNATLETTGNSALITTPDTLVFALSGNSTTIWTLTKLTNGDFFIMCTESNSLISSGNYISRTYNTTNMEQLVPAFYPYKMVSDDQHYHQFNPLWRTMIGYNSRDYQFSASVRGLTRGADLGSGVAFEVAGTDIIVPHRYFKDQGVTYDQNTCLVIKGGNL